MTSTLVHLGSLSWQSGNQWSYIIYKKNKNKKKVKGGCSLENQEKKFAASTFNPPFTAKLSSRKNFPTAVSCAVTWRLSKNTKKTFASLPGDTSQTFLMLVVLCNHNISFEKKLHVNAQKSLKVRNKQVKKIKNKKLKSHLFQVCN